jgi:hemoglobin
VSGQGISEADLALLVDRFYARVRRDGLIGPLFNAAIHDWPEHLERLSAFWSSVMLTSGRYKGSPMAAHMRHAGQIRPEMFSRWLELWRETARDTLAPDAAEAVSAKAERIAESLQLGLYFNLDKQRGAAAA